MPIPNLIKVVPVHLRRQNRAVSVFDSRAREPVRQLWKAGQGPGTGVEDVLEGQVHWTDGKIEKPVLGPGGAEEKSTGYVLFRVFDLLAAGVATENADGTVDLGIVRGDKIVRIGIRRVSLFVLFFRDAAHHTDQGGATIVEVNFSDREPSARS